MKDNIFDCLKEKIPGVEKNTPLKNYTTFKIGGPAKYFFVAKTEEDLAKAIMCAKKLRIAFYVIGWGGNLLVSDKGFKGLIIKTGMKNITAKDITVNVGAGVYSSEIVKFALEKSLSGMEWFVGIPSTIGGAVYGNAQAFGTKTSDVIKSVRAFDIRKLEFVDLPKEKCSFSLKSSIFKKKKNLIVISVELQLKQGDKKEIEKKVKEHLDYRKKFHPIEFPSAGSVFVNPEKEIKNKKLLEKYPELNEFNEKGYIHSGYLIEKVGLKGKKIGGAQISEKHANFIINVQDAKAKDILRLIALVKSKVKKEFGLILEQEVQQIGF